MFLAPRHQRHDQKLGAFADAFDLHPEKFFLARGQGFGGGQAFGLDQGMHLLAQPGIGDAQEAPGLHVADRGREVGGFDQALEQALGQRLGLGGGDEVAHVAAFAQGPPEGGDLGVAVAGIGRARAHGASFTGTGGRSPVGWRENKGAGSWR